MIATMTADELLDRLSVTGEIEVMVNGGRATVHRALELARELPGADIESLARRAAHEHRLSRDLHVQDDETDLLDRVREAARRDWDSGVFGRR